MALGVVTLTFTRPTGSAGDTAVIDVADLTVKLRALVEPNLTAVAPVKLLPVMVRTAPPDAGPCFADISLMTGPATVGDDGP